MNKFTDTYEKFSNNELVNIILNQSDYQLSAIKAAKTEIEKRNLSDEEIEKEIIALKKDKTMNSATDEIQKKGYTVFNNLFKKLNPFQKELSSTEKIIRAVIIILSVFFLNKLFSRSVFIFYLISDSFKMLDLSVSLDLLPLLILPLSVIYLYKRKTVGWILTVIYFTYSFIGITAMLIFEVLNPMDNLGFMGFYFQKISLPSYIVGSLFFGAVLFSILKKNIREIFNVDNVNFIGSVFVGLILGILLIGLIY
jgi:hypothetical protein